MSNQSNDPPNLRDSPLTHSVVHLTSSPRVVLSSYKSHPSLHSLSLIPQKQLDSLLGGVIDNRDAKKAVVAALKGIKTDLKGGGSAGQAEMSEVSD
jgi:hypothetical protein